MFHRNWLGLMLVGFGVLMLLKGGFFLLPLLFFAWPLFFLPMLFMAKRGHAWGHQGGWHGHYGYRGGCGGRSERSVERNEERDEPKQPGPNTGETVRL
jgi:hypothetical protein